MKVKIKPDKTTKEIFKMFKNTLKDRMSAFTWIIAREMAKSFKDKVAENIPTDAAWQNKYRESLYTSDIERKDRAAAFVGVKKIRGSSLVDPATFVVYFIEPPKDVIAGALAEVGAASFRYKRGAGKILAKKYTRHNSLRLILSQFSPWAVSELPGIIGGYPRTIPLKFKYVGEAGVKAARDKNQQDERDNKIKSWIQNIGYTIGRRTFPNLGGKVAIDIGKSVMALEFGLTGVTPKKAHWTPAYKWLISSGFSDIVHSDKVVSALEDFTNPVYKPWRRIGKAKKGVKIMNAVRAVPFMDAVRKGSGGMIRAD